MEKVKDSKRTLQGVVMSTKMQKTITVQVTRTERHSKYNKFVNKNAKYLAHDEHSSCGLGDKVVIVEARPTSKLKRWRLERIIEKASE